ncbi:DTW domain-containing protein [Bacteriovoracaceae bacterium]|nr:DTW domain-containing protein [Bacteriovoracaceae bacterium]
MSKRRINAKKRCERCRLTPMWCICHKIHTGYSKVNLTFITHFRERHLSSNTVNLVTQTLPQSSQMFYYGQKDNPIQSESILSKNQLNLFLYPDNDAISLEQIRLSQDQKINLIVPDGTWTQAKKVKRRNTFLHNIQSVKLAQSLKITSSYQLRRQTDPSHFCTLEAVAYALEVLENKEENKNLLLQNLKFFNHNTMLARNAYLLNYSEKY